MIAPPRSRLYATTLVGGALLFGVAGLCHPLLSGDGADQLARIAATPGWRMIHWSLLFGLPLMLLGLIGLAGRHLDTAAAATACAAAGLAIFAFAAWFANIAFMAGAGWRLAQVYASESPGLAAGRAVFLYDMLHPAGLAAERLATFALGLSAYVFGWAVLRGAVLPRWLAGLAFAAGAVCLVVPLTVDEFTNWMYYAQGAFVAWEAAAGVVLLVRRPEPRG